MRLWLATVGILLAAAGGMAQEYRFSLPEMLLNVYVNPDASITMDYDMVFECAAGAHPIDVVDVGLPHQGYDISNMSASLELIGAGQGEMPLGGIRKSSAIDCGVEVPLRPPIQPGQRGRFRFRCTMPDMVYQDTTRQDYASLRVTPTWYGSEYLVGATRLGIVINLPREIQPDEVLHQGRNFTHKVTLQDYTALAWYDDAARLDGPYMVAASFPKRVMNRVVYMSRLKLLLKWWQDHPETRLVVALVFFVLFGIMFFRFSAGTGCSCFLALLIGLGALFASSPGAQLLALPVFIALWFLTERSLRRRRGKYLPAIASVEGGGIKRGLTAPEAAVILELPLGRVLSLVIFGLLKKGILEQTSASPLQVRVKPQFVGTAAQRQRAAADAGTTIHAYEQPFLDALQKAADVPVQNVDFKEAMRNLIDQTVRRMSGFDLDKTRSYYRSIVARAWAQAKNLGDVDQRTSFADENLLWLLLDDDCYDRDHFGGWPYRGYYYDPPWVRTTTFGAPAAPAPAGTPVGGKTSFGDVAGSFAGWAENVTGSLASQLDGVSVGLTKGGVVDLSGADRLTVDVLKAMTESSASGGGGGGGCACACAGCACACACAGGGR